MKNLGLVVNSRSTWHDHAVKISQRIIVGLRSLWPLSKSTPQKTRYILAKSLLIPHLDYCSVVFYYGLDGYSLKVLNNSIKSIVRYVYGLGRYASTESYVSRFLGSSLDTFFKVRAMTFLYKLDTMGQPAYLKELLLRGSSERSKQFLVLPSERVVGTESLFVQGLID